MSDKKFELPTQEDSWAKVELWRWQYGTLPRQDDMRPLDVSEGLRGMAAAIRKGDRSNFPTPFNVITVLEYVANVISANAHALAEERSDDSQQRVVGGKVDG